MPRYSLSFEEQLFHFNKPAGTSRGVLQEKVSYFLTLSDTGKGRQGLGECSLLPKLSPDLQYNLEGALKNLQKEVAQAKNLSEITIPEHFPALKFAFETAQIDLEAEGDNILFPSEFTFGKKGIPINGLIWMAEPETMWQEITAKVHQYPCIKLKVGALDFEKEKGLLQRIRSEYGEAIEIRLDANGAFSPDEALDKLGQLSAFSIHSIEQPIRHGQWEEMAFLCQKTPIPIALDEELIGNANNKNELLEKICPQYIILKPSLIGGLAESDKWIAEAEKNGIGWWATSALESNLGLNAIAQWVATKNTAMPQGLGTGALYERNIDMGLFIRDGQLWRTGQE